MKEKVHLFGAYMSIEKDHKTIGHGNFIHQYEHTPCIGELTNVLKKDEPLIDTVVILNLQFLTKEQYYALKGEKPDEQQLELGE